MPPAWLPNSALLYRTDGVRPARLCPQLLLLMWLLALLLLLLLRATTLSSAAVSG
jgi:hypothetical protein